MRTMPRLVIEVSSPPSTALGIESSPSKHHSMPLFIFLGGIILLLLLILIFIARKMIKPVKFRTLVARAVKRPVTQDILSGNLRMISYFNFDTLKKATKNFNQMNLLGRGGFGPVYLGKLDDGRLIAVKKLALEKSQQGESEFLSEVRMITSIQHKNLVRLLGCCSDGAQRLLVYEYMKNRSLDLIVYGKNDIFLNWGTRFQIILGVARGLQYLHEDSHVRIIHRDIKASNILLDDKFQPRIGDFGLARFFPEDQAYLSTAFAGTLGYTAPEYAIRGELTEKADIYSFGVLVLEIISCRRNTDLTLPSEMQYLPEYAWKLYERSALNDLIDPRIREDGCVETDVLHAIRVAFLCLQPQANQRPPMSEIVAILTCKVEMETMPTKPAFLERKKRHEEKISWDSISEPFPSPLRSDSPSFPRHLNSQSDQHSQNTFFKNGYPNSLLPRGFAPVGTRRFWSSKAKVLADEYLEKRSLIELLLLSVAIGGRLKYCAAAATSVEVEEVMRM